MKKILLLLTKNILKYKKSLRFVSIITVIVVAVFTVGFLFSNLSQEQGIGIQEDNVQDLIEKVDNEEFDPLVEQTVKEDINLIIKDFSPSGATFYLSSLEQIDYNFNDIYKVEIFEDNVWKEAPFYVEYTPSDDPLHTVKSNEISEEFTINWEWLYGKLPDGDYRLVKTVFNNVSERNIYAEFSLANGEKS